MLCTAHTCVGWLNNFLSNLDCHTRKTCRLFRFGYTVDIDSNFHFRKRVEVMSVFIVYSCLLGLYFICRCSGQRYSYNDVSLFCIENWFVANYTTHGKWTPSVSKESKRSWIWSSYVGGPVTCVQCRFRFRSTAVTLHLGLVGCLVFFKIGIKIRF